MVRASPGGRRHPGRRQGGRNARTRQGNLLGFLLIVGVFCVIAVVGSAYFWLANNQVKLDEAFCPKDGATSLTAVLIDRTDVVNEVQQADLRAHLEVLRDTIPRQGRLAVYTLSDEPGAARVPAFALCNPGSGDDLSPWIANPELARRRWESVFEAPLKEILDGAIAGGNAKSSPIFEAVQAVAVAEFAPARPESSKRLVIISDLLHHTADFTLYISDPSASDFRSLSTLPYYARVRTDLKGAAVTVLYLRRDSGLGRWPQHNIIFWRDYLLDQGAGDLNIVAVQG
jgi:hypothetical protein